MTCGSLEGIHQPFLLLITRPTFYLSVLHILRDKVYLAIDRELTARGHSEDKYAKKKKGDIGFLPTVTSNKEAGPEVSKQWLPVAL